LQTKIYGLDRGALLYYAKALALGAARDDVAGIAWHCYGGPTYMDVLHTLDPTLQQIVSECSPGIIPYTAAEALISSLRNWASAALLWNLALDPAGGPVQLPNLGCRGCTGVVTISEQTHAVTYGLNYYQLGQISKFVVPGAVRIAANALVSDFRTPDGVYGVTTGLDDVAFRNPDGTTVLVTYNDSASWIRFAVAANGRWFQAGIPPGAMTTFEWK
jgi:glucosylceramidase